ncbi:hypothetical protein CIL05_01395 [Virgibacillus profundi]|uniref:NERD domain-containing protein n=1 Tax=Virgibacillus profundi TaxID=2024555 RepID=A0A2A2IJ35_9BACI|nr:nuclease-related domain-containing protein [Virgibacillus profundi]PAV31336.1 hypothetical protein CIL05_01395 [Virgibacillus profundi]PXY55522.1 NERD domain-containing protein [Virgibacillus profundi]
MIKLHRTKPYVILCYEALFRRLKEKYRNNNVINQDYWNYLAGYRGEQTVDYKLSTYPQKRFFEYQSLRLKVNHNFFQIDSLLLSSKFILIIEAKNMKGELNYNSDSGHLTQTYKNVEKGYQSPILQANSQEMQLSYWLQQVISVYGIPIESLVIVSDPSTIIKNNQNDPTFYNKMIYADNLIPKIKEMTIKYTKNVLNKNILYSINDAFLKYNTPLKPKLLDYYNINENHLIKGIQCENCGSYPMKRMYKTWKCDKCFYADPTAHVRLILDYFLLHNATITNSECRNLLQIDSGKTAYTILNSMNLTQTGKNKARKYYAPKLELFPQDSFVPNKKKTILQL